MLQKNPIMYVNNTSDNYVNAVFLLDLLIGFEKFLVGTYFVALYIIMLVKKARNTVL